MRPRFIGQIAVHLLEDFDHFAFRAALGHQRLDLLARAILQFDRHIDAACAVDVRQFLLLLAGRAQIDDGLEADGLHGVQIAVARIVQCARSVQTARSQTPAIGGGVAAAVTKVVDGFHVNLSVAVIASRVAAKQSATDLH